MAFRRRPEIGGCGRANSSSGDGIFCSPGGRLYVEGVEDIQSLYVVFTMYKPELLSQQEETQMMLPSETSKHVP